VIVARPAGNWACSVQRMAVVSHAMKPWETSECPNCKPIARRLAKLEQQLADTLQRIDTLGE